MYWNADRICADLDRWIVFVRLRAGEPVGCVYYMDADDGWYEIFGIDTKDGAFDPGLFRELVGAALSEAKRRGGKYMTFFCGGESQALAEELEAAACDYARYSELYARKEELDKKLQELMDRWEVLAEEAEA